MTATYTVDIKRLTIKDMATLQRASTQGLQGRQGTQGKQGLQGRQGTQGIIGSGLSITNYGEM